MDTADRFMLVGLLVIGALLLLGLAAALLLA
jgi:hypothetical protein